MSDQALSFGKFYDILAANAEPTVHILKSNDIEPGSVAIHQSGVYVHPDDSERAEAVAAAAGWRTEWCN